MGCKFRDRHADVKKDILCQKESVKKCSKELNRLLHSVFGFVFHHGIDDVTESAL